MQTGKMSSNKKKDIKSFQNKYNYFYKTNALLMKRLFFFLFCLYLLPYISSAQSFSNNTGGPIADVATSVFPLSISGLPLAIDSSFGLKGVAVNLLHT
jgi:hypothetical protein